MSRTADSATTNKSAKRRDLKGIARTHQADRYYKRFSSRTHLTTLLFGILSRCDSMGEICEALGANICGVITSAIIAGVFITIIPMMM